MLTRAKRLWVLWGFFAILATACKMPAPNTPQPDKLDPQALFTAAAMTAEARRLTTLAAPSPEVLLASVMAPTATTTKAAALATPSPTAPAETASPLSTEGASGSLQDRAEFVTDVTIPDDTAFQPNDLFTKTWRL